MLVCVLSILWPQTTDQPSPSKVSKPEVRKQVAFKAQVDEQPAPAHNPEANKRAVVAQPRVNNEAASSSRAGASDQATSSPKPSAVRQSPKPMNLSVKKQGVVQQSAKPEVKEPAVVKQSPKPKANAKPNIDLEELQRRDSENPVEVSVKKIRSVLVWLGDRKNRTRWRDNFVFVVKDVRNCVPRVILRVGDHGLGRWRRRSRRGRLHRGEDRQETRQQREGRVLRQVEGVPGEFSDDISFQLIEESNSVV